MNLHFRRMKKADIADVYKIEVDLFPDPWSQKVFEDEINSDKYSFPFVLESKKEIIGYCVGWYYLNELHIGNFAIKRNQQKNGFGKLLMEKTLETFSGYELAYLEVAVTNKSAIKLYSKFGFKEISKRKSYYTNNEDAVVMIKYA